MFESLLKIVTGDRRIVDSSEQAAVAQEQKTAKTVKAKFTYDFNALKGIGCDIKEGGMVSMELKDALVLMPRDRKRVDAYKALTEYLDKEFGFKLIINSQKTKRHDKI